MPLAVLATLQSDTYIHIYIYTYIFRYTYIHTHTYHAPCGTCEIAVWQNIVCVSSNMYIPLYVCVSSNMYIVSICIYHCMSVWLLARTHTRARAHTHTHTHTYNNIYISTLYTCWDEIRTYAVSMVTWQYISTLHLKGLVYTSTLQYMAKETYNMTKETYYLIVT